MATYQRCCGGPKYLSRRQLQVSCRRLCPLVGASPRRPLGACPKASPEHLVNVAQAADILIQHAKLGALVPPSGGAPTVDHSTTHQDIQCTLSGLDSVMCVIEDVPDSADEAPAPVAAPVESGLLATVTKAALLTSPFFFWGTSMVAMKSVVPHTTPLLLGSLRLLPAGVILVAWALANGRSQPSTLKAWGWVLAFALIDAAAFQGFLAEGLTKTSAGLGSVIIDSQPLSVAVLASLLFGEQLSGVGVAGLLLGVAGLALLEVPVESLGEGAHALLSGAWRPELALGLPSWEGLQGLGSSGEFWMLLAAQSMAVGTVMVRYVTKHCDPIMATGWHMIIGGALLAAAAASSGGADAASAAGPLASLGAQLSHLTPEDLMSMSYVSLMGGALSYGIFFWNASHGNLTSLSSLTFLTPVFAAGAGYLALGEVLSPMQLLGGAVTLSAVWCINHRPDPPTPPGKAQAPAAAPAPAQVQAQAK